MRVLFVCSGNRGVSPIISAQAESLIKSMVFVEIKPLIGKGMVGYLSNIGEVRKKIKRTKPDLIHAHYSFCGIVASLATRKKVVCSLMGSDVKSSGPWRLIIRLFVKHFWAATIVKSEDMKQSLGLSSVTVIPNGVDLDIFKPMDKDYCREKLGWPKGKKYILFAADPARKEKNYPFADQAVKLLDRQDAELKVVYGVHHSELPTYMNASDLLVLTSLWEGSPNVVKEAMACDLPVVSTAVGDVKWLFGNTSGYQVVENAPAKIAETIEMVLNTEYPARGRERLKSLYLDSGSVAQRIINVYQINSHGRRKYF